MAPTIESWKVRNAQNTRRLALSTGLWLLTMAIAMMGPRYFWQANTTLTWLAITVNVLAGLFMLLASRIHLNGQDELQQKIQLQAMAFALGVGLVGGFAWSMLERAQLIGTPASIPDLAILMSFAYMAGILHGYWRYR